MKVTVYEGTPEEIAELLPTIVSSQEQSVICEGVLYAENLNVENSLSNNHIYFGPNQPKTLQKGDIWVAKDKTILF
ncbi:TPA: hypothetical protein ACGBG5_003443 [Enterococcus faecalis]